MVSRASWGWIWMVGELDVGGMKFTCGFVLCGGVGGGPADRPTLPCTCAGGGTSRAWQYQRWLRGSVSKAGVKRASSGAFE